MHLKTLGHPDLYDAAGATVRLRRKDLALLVYLCVESTAVHARSRLAGMLWGENREGAARHSLTQALGRLGRVLPPGSLVVETQAVRWTGTIPCDAVQLRGELDPAGLDASFPLYGGDFLQGFTAGKGAEMFDEWAEGQQTALRNAALRLLERAGEEAAGRQAWRRAARLAERAVEIDPVGEVGHRRLMRAWAASGERNRALRHYQDFEKWLRDVYGADPDPETRALAEQLKASGASPDAPDPPAPAVPPPRDPAPPPAPAQEPKTQPGAAPSPEEAAHQAPVAEPPAVPPTPPGADSAPAPASGGARGNLFVPDPPRAGAPPTVPAARAPGRLGEAGRVIARMTARVLFVVILGLVIRAFAEARIKAWRDGVQPPGHGENVRVRGTRQVYLAFAETLYAYPDAATLRACTRHSPPAVRQVRALPAWPRERLPSVTRNPWMRRELPVVSDHPEDKTAYVPAGCILAGVPDPPTLDSIFGPGALARMQEVPDSVLQRMPRAFIARGQPVRAPGTLLRAPDGRLRWVTYHGGALAVGDSAVLATYCRAPRDAVPVSLAEFNYYRPFARLVATKPKCPPTR